MARRTQKTAERVKTTNDLFNDRFYVGNVLHGSIDIRSLRNFANMCKAIGTSNKTTFTAKDLGVWGMTMEYALKSGIILFNRTDVQETRTVYQQVDNPDNRMVVTKKTKVTYYQPVDGVDYKALAEATTAYILNQIKDI